MQEVSALDEQEKLLFEAMLAKHYSDLYLSLWKFGINTALRISDLIELKFSDFDMGKEEFTITERKTKKKRIVSLNSKALEIIVERKKSHPGDVYLFQTNSNRAATNSHISRASVSRIFKEAGDRLGLHISTHSMRKTRGAAMYHSGRYSLASISKMLNHSSIKTTMQYIGVEQKHVQASYEDFEL